MELIKISCDHLIFILDREDLTKYEIEAKNSISKLKDNYSRIVSDSGIGDQFLTRVLVQIFDCPNGGCEMFVTKIPDNSDCNNSGYKRHVYIFDSLTPLLASCKMLKTQKAKEAYAYYDRIKRKYYISLENECPYMGEFFGTRCKDDEIYYINEHCELISSNAAKELSSLA